MKSVRYVTGFMLLWVCLYNVSGFVLKTPSEQKIKTTADCPIIITNNIVITQPTCGQSNGSITGVTVTASGDKIIYTWRDGKFNIVGSKLDLINIPEGIYQLEVSDNSGCASRVFSYQVTVTDASDVIIGKNPVITPTNACNNIGSITGLEVIGATMYKWRNLNTGDVYTSSASADLLNVAAGTYVLTASNATCSTVSDAYVISYDVDLPQIISVTIKNPTCLDDNDIITVNMQRDPQSPTINYFFANETGLHYKDAQIIGGIVFPSVFLQGVGGGTYGLYVFGADYACPVQIGKFTLKEAKVMIYPDSSQIFDDNCNQHLGAIVPYITGVTTPRPVAQYTWIDNQTQKVIGHTSLLERVGAGSYTLEVIDPKGCTGFATFTLKNNSPSIIPPIASGTTLCLPGTAIIQVQNPDTAGVFKLYASQTDSVALATNPQGLFVVHVNKTTDYYVARKHGICESERTKVTEVVVADVNIPNTFTPNNDGINDYWNIAGLDKFPGADISVFNRSGALIYHSINYANPFNGKYNGADLPAGVYYYVIDVKQPICFGKISGSLTIIK